MILVITILLIADIILIRKVRRNKYILNKKDTQGIIMSFGVTFILIGSLLMGASMIAEGNQKYTYSNKLETEHADEHHTQMPQITNIIIKENKYIALCEDKSVWIWNKNESKDTAVPIDKINAANKIVDEGTVIYILSDNGYVYQLELDKAKAYNKNVFLGTDIYEQEDVSYSLQKNPALFDIVDLDAKNGKSFAIDAQGKLYMWGVYLYWDEYKDNIPNFPKESAELAADIKFLSAGSDGFNYFIRNDRTIFSVMEYSMFEGDGYAKKFIFPSFGEENVLADTPFWDIPYTDLREGTKYAVTILYELGKADDVINMESDGYTVFCAKKDSTLWYWDSGTVKYHDHTDAIADPETYLENYQGSWKEIDIREALGLSDSTSVPQIKDICSGKENTIFLTEDGQVFFSKYVTTKVEDVYYYYQGSTKPDRETTGIFQDMNLKTLAFEKLDYQKIVSVNTDGLYSFTLVDEDGEWYEIDFTRK